MNILQLKRKALGYMTMGNSKTDAAPPGYMYDGDGYLVPAPVAATPVPASRPANLPAGAGAETISVGGTHGGSSNTTDQTVSYIMGNGDGTQTRYDLNGNPTQTFAMGAGGDGWLGQTMMKVAESPVTQNLIKAGVLAGAGYVGAGAAGLIDAPAATSAATSAASTATPAAAAPEAALTGSDAHFANIAAGADAGPSLSGTLPTVTTPAAASPWSANALAGNFGKNALTNAEIQAVLTGKIDPNSVLTGAATGTVGGAIAGSVAPDFAANLPAWAAQPASSAVGALGIAGLTGQPLDKALGNSLTGSLINGLVGSNVADFTGSDFLGSLANAYVGNKVGQAINPGSTGSSNGPLTTTSTTPTPYNPGKVYDPGALGTHSLQTYGPVFKQGVTA